MKEHDIISFLLIFNESFTMPEIQQSIKTIKNKNNPGPDGIHPEFTKNLGEDALEILLVIYNKIWKKEKKKHTFNFKKICNHTNQKESHLTGSYKPHSLS